MILDNHIPGPNAYKNQSLFGCNIFDSKYKSPSFISLSKKFKFRNRNAGNPGPGSYIRFSEFGILAPKKEKDKDKSKEKGKENSKNDNSNEEVLNNENEKYNDNSDNNQFEKPPEIDNNENKVN